MVNKKITITLIIMLIVIIVTLLIVLADSEGPNLPNTAYDSIGPGTKAWATPENIKVDDGSDTGAQVGSSPA